MKKCYGCFETKPAEAFGKVKGSSDGLRPRCNECRKIESRAAWLTDLENNRAKAAKRRRDDYRADPEKYRAAARKWRELHPTPKKPRALLSPEERLRRKRASRIATYEKNKEKVLPQAAIYRAAHKAEELAARAAHYQRNKERVAEVTKAYRLAHKSLYAAAGAKRRAAEIKATPQWADLKKIALIYEEAARLTRETGVLHEVDHIIPIQGRVVCGLHVENNLQILTRSANRSKSNKLLIAA